MDKNVIEILNQRRIILGPKDRIKSSKLSKYPWAYKLFKEMQENEWLASGVSLGKDKPSSLNAGSQVAVRRALAFLTGLDGIQVDNLATNVIDHVTDYTVKQCIYRQIYEEVNHVDAYATIIETYYDDPMEIYLLHESNDILREKNDYVLAQANGMGNEFNAEKFVYAVVSNIILEGVFFHSGFLLFYVIARIQRELMGGAEMIQYIQRDETTHLVLFKYIFQTLKKEFPEAFTAKTYSKIEKLIDASVNLEIGWGHHITESGVPGLSKVNQEHYIKNIADENTMGMGIPAMYNIKNPYPWVKEFTSMANKNEKNFFESKPQAYSKKTLDFDDM